MSELKEFTFGMGQYTEDGSPCVVAFDGERNPRLASDETFYFKSEADKVIAEKDAKILALDAEVFKQKHHAKLFFDERNYAENQLRKQRYKRCLAMAKWCENEEKRLEAIAPLFDTDKEYWEYNSDYWGKWCWRWLQLAEKFKEAK